ncbi:PaaI family thioesterase [Oceanobacillus senegalensis]|uniref:PaaI family thioesterase n=1 Tax=Oceanobacillus senegalensis TaxID=1936063 RepID=UPI000A307003|nr:PaaI family thioesterase [Oceanobacillus senegalensis]
MDQVISQDYLQWLRNEFENSPYWKHMGISFKKLESGKVIIHMPVKNQLMNSNNVIHGGAITSLLDSVIGATIRSSKKVRLATITLTTNFIKPVSEGTIYATANLLNSGNRIQFVEAKVLNENNEILGTAQGTFYLFKLE